jgi:hypothetical protein
MDGLGNPGLKRVSSTKAKYYLSDKNMFTQTQVGHNDPRISKA